MEFLGIIRSVGEPTEWTGQSQTHVEREIVVATAEEYPQVGVFTLKDELAQNFSLQPGATVRISFDLKAFTTKEGKTYNHLRAWRIS